MGEINICPTTLCGFHFQSVCPTLILPNKRVSAQKRVLLAFLLLQKGIAYRNNYKGKNPMTQTQWRRYQWSKKGIAAKANNKAADPKEKLVETFRRPMKERLSLPLVEENNVEDDEMDSDFMDSEPDFDTVCNVVSI